jgi:c-di-GMP-binding flagellar brake protein YcgR
MDEKKPDHRISVEWGMHLQLRFQGFAESHKSVLVGMERGAYLICTAPRVSGLWVQLGAKNQTVVRYLHGGVVYGFKSTILGMVEEPFRLLFLSYPEAIETVNLRQHERIPCLIPSGATVAGVAYKGVLLDISVGGCCFAFNLQQDEEKPEAKPGDDILLSLHMAGVSLDEQVNMAIENVRYHGNRVTIGGSFRDIRRETSEAIQEYIDTVEGLVNLEEA